METSEMTPLLATIIILTLPILLLMVGSLIMAEFTKHDRMRNPDCSHGTCMHRGK